MTTGWTAPTSRPFWGRVAGGVICAAAGAVLYVAPLGDALSRLSFDVSCLFQNRVPEEVVLVFLDRETKVALKEAVEEPLPLRRHAQLIERLRRDGARLVLCDILLDQRSDEEIAQSRLAELFTREMPVVLVSAQLQWVEHVYSTTKSVWPVPALARAAAGVGLARLTLDPDGVVRRIDLGTDTDPAAALVAAGLLKHDPSSDGSKAPSRPRWLNYYGAPEFLRAVRFEQALEPNGLGTGYFRGKIVIVGAGVEAGLPGATAEAYASPFTRWGGGLVSGAAVHAISLLNLWREDWLARWPAGMELAILFLAGGLAGFGLTGQRPRSVVALGLGAILVVAALGIVSHCHARQWWSWVILSGVQLPLAAVWAVAFNAIREYRDKAVLLNSLSLYFSPARARQVMMEPHFLKPGARRQETSLLMTDIQGFSRVTALMHPEDLMRLLNDYYERAIECIHRTHGTVMDLVGDSIFALWNAPEAQANHRILACQSALALHRALREFDHHNPSLPLRTRMGLHSGEVLVGNVGSRTRFDYAALGEAVNLTARLETLNRSLGTEILATRDMAKAAQGLLVSRLAGHFSFHGIDQPVAVYELHDESQGSDSSAWLNPFAEALHEFQRKQFRLAEAGFNRVLQIKPADGPSRFYLQKIAELRDRPLPADWMGVVEIEGK